MYQWNRNSMKYKMSVSMKIKIGNAMYHFSCNVIVGLHISQSAWCGLVISLAYAGCNTRDMECKHKWHAHMNVCAVGILDSALLPYPKRFVCDMENNEDMRCHQAWHEPQTCTHMYRDSCRVARIMWYRPMTLCVAHAIARLMWHILWSRCPMAQAHPTSCAYIIPRQLHVSANPKDCNLRFAIWRFRDFKIVKSWDCEIYRLRDLEIATSEIVKGVDCEYCGVWHMRVSQSLSRRIWAMTKCRLDLNESFNNVLTEIKSDKRTCRK